MNNKKPTVGANCVRLQDKQNAGITLIALIITIIIMLILAVVTIREVTGDGLINKAISARDEYKKEQEEEKIKLAINEWKILKNSPNSTTGTLQDFLIEKFGEENVSLLGTDIIVKVNGFDIKIDKDGNILSSNSEISNGENPEGEGTSVETNVEIIETTLSAGIENGNIEVGDYIEYTSGNYSYWKVLGVAEDGNIEIVLAGSIGSAFDENGIIYGTKEEYNGWANEVNTLCSAYANGTNAIAGSGRALTVEDVAKVLGITLTTQNSAQSITGTFPDGTEKTETVVDNYNLINISTAVTGKKFDLLNQYCFLGSTCINIWDNVAYFNIYRIAKNYDSSSPNYNQTWLDALERHSTSGVYNNDDAIKFYRPVVKIDKNTTVFVDKNNKGEVFTTQQGKQSYIQRPYTNKTEYETYARNLDFTLLTQEQYENNIPEGATKIALPYEVRQIDRWKFNNSSITKILIPNSVVDIGNGAFNSSSITSITFRGITYTDKTALNDVLKGAGLLNPGLQDNSNAWN